MAVGAALMAGSRLTPMMRAQLVDKCPLVLLTRLAGPRGRTLDDDNLRGCLKAARDAVAEWLGVDDADRRIAWDYQQTKDDAWGVRVEVLT